ncbi:hypothetical protein MARPU_09545 [Marichromatium purpuratum 984]|uniref:Uncharacterized protein n=1 Tax=Marichromatium purpuratum 984 TaxID=765910 RepID=W0E8F3_MARPU|nr:hypothetical protein [Marichromatium purpuratum]AHF05509.1 hypothetical protein MARPU_09545 [Marichromatium purpuratum 984]
MLDANNFKLVSVTPPAAIIDAASATTAEVDTKGWEHARIIAYLGATDVAMSALKVTESDTSGSGHADVPGLVYGTSTDIAGSTSALPTADADNTFFVFDLDLRGRKRYLDVIATCGDGSTGTFLTIWAELYRGDVAPHTVAGHGAGGMLKR